MEDFIKFNKNIVIYSIITLIVIPIFGIKLFIGFLSNILLLIFLLTLLILLIIFLSLNYFKSRFKSCPKCGAISLTSDGSCMNCGSELDYIQVKDTGNDSKPGDRTIEIKAEEIK